MKNYFVILGDILAIALVTAIGFATHGETNLSFLPRFLASFVPLTLAWFLIAPWLGLFRQEVASDRRQLWRPVLAVILAAPFAALVRAIVLSTVIIPIFAIVLGGVSAIGMLCWRTVYLFLTRRASR